MQTFVVVAGILVFAFVIYNSFFKSSKAGEIKETEQEPSTGVATPTDPVFVEGPQPVQKLVSDEELPKAEVPIAEPVKEEVVEAVVQPESVVEKEVKEEKPKKEKASSTEKTKKTEEKPKQKTKKEDDKPVKKSKSK